MHLENGNTFTMNANNNSKSNYFIQSTTLNNKKYPHNFIKYDAIQNGGTFEFNLSDTPNKKWGSKNNNLPFSLSNSDLLKNE